MEITVETLLEYRDGGSAHVVLDVREPWEREICSLSGSLEISMRDIPARVGEIPRDMPVIVLCHHGMRSGQVTAWLRAQGYENAVNLAGGIDAVACSVDGLARY